MNKSITSTQSVYNSYPVVSSLTTRNFKINRKYLPDHEFKKANQQKAMWLKAVIKECNLRGNEIPVLEALVFLTDPVNGDGTPSVGAIQEKAQERSTGIHRRTVGECLKRLEQKGAIIKVQRGKKITNFYRLIGYDSKLESCCDESLHSLNSSSLPKRGEKKKSYKIINKPPLACPDGRHGVQIEEPKPNDLPSEIEVLRGKEARQRIKEMYGI